MNFITEDIKNLFLKYYKEQEQLLATVLTHSQAVARKAIECIRKRGLNIDLDFVIHGAMTHDIGVVKCNAPSIHCLGSEPYICHGLIGRKMLEKEGLYRQAMICERHTGSGLSINDIKRQKLPLPLRNMMPLTIEEKLICYADKFFSKSGELEKEKPFEKVCIQMERFGEESLNRFIDMHEMFG